MMRLRNDGLVRFTKLVVLVPLFILMTGFNIFAQNPYKRLVQKFEASELGIANPAGLAYSPAADALLVAPSANAANLMFHTFAQDGNGSETVATAIVDPLNMAFDGNFNRLLFYDAIADELVGIKANSKGRPRSSSSAITRFDASAFGVKKPTGITIDPETGNLFILVDPAPAVPRIARIIPDKRGRFVSPEVSIIELNALQGSQLHGIAFNPNDGHLYIISPTEQKLYEITQEGQVLTTRDLSAFELSDPQNMAFAPSGDQTDDPAIMSLYIANSGLSSKQGLGDITELSLTQPVVLDFSALTIPTTLVRTILTSQWSPPSPDPSDIAYIPSSNSLMVSDGEVNEMSIYDGVNYWEVTLSGNQIHEYTTVAFSDEPCGEAYNPNNHHLFFSDDTGTRSVYELDPGPDGLYNTSDDIVTSFKTKDFSSADPEGLTYDTFEGHLFLVDGVNAEVYEISPGANGRFDGVSSGDDVVVQHFDTAKLGQSDPEGVEFNTDTGTLYIVSNNGSNSTVVEVTRTGTALNVIDIGFLNPHSPAGLAYAPSSVNPLEKSLYIVDRGSDNDSHPNENDGKMYEISLGSTTPSIVIDDVIVTEGNSGTIEAVFTVSLSSISPQDVTVQYTTADGSATAGSDYNTAFGSISIPQGEISRPVTITVNGDAIDEPNETFFVNLSNAENANMGDDQGMGTIMNDDGSDPITISFQDGVNGFNGTRDTALEFDNPDRNNGSAIEIGADGRPDIASLLFWDVTSIPIGSTVQSVDITVNITNTSSGDYEIYDLKRAWVENEATWNVYASGQIWQVAGADGSADRGTTAFGAIAGSSTGSNTTALNVAGVAVVQSWVDNPPSNHGFIVQDYINHTNGLAFSSREAGTVAQRPKLTVTYAPSSGPSLSIGDATVTEGNSGTVNAIFTITLSEQSGQTVTVDYATADGSATAGSDYVTASGPVIFPPGETSQQVTVTVNGDVLDEANETFVVDLSNPANANVGDAQGTGTINDDDVPPSLSINDVGVTEGNSGTIDAVFTVTLSSPSGQIVTVNYTTANGTATAGSDYVAANGPVSFSPGEISKQVTVAVNGDVLDEPNETFVVNLSNPSNATLGNAQGTGTITDDDAPPSLSIDDVSVLEGNSGTIDAVFTVALSAESGQTVTVNYATADGSATAGSDYVAASDLVSFAPGETSQEVTVTVMGDGLDEGNEMFEVNLSNAVNATIGDAQGTGTIIDDDGVPSLSIEDVSVLEGNNGTVDAIFTVMLSNTTGQTVTVNYATADGSATAGSDYVASTGPVSIPPGEISQQVSVTVIGDVTEEPDETFVVNLSNALNATIGDAQGTGTITNDDGLEPTTASFQDGIDGYAGARDTKLLSQEPATNFGSVAELEIDGSPDRSALLYWDLASIPSGSIIQSVDVTVDITNKTGHTYEFYELLRPWVEGEATWNEYASGQSWELAGADGSLDRGSTVLGTITGSKGLATILLNSAGVAVVQSWVDNPPSNNGFIILNYISATDGMDFASREHGTASNRPKLTVMYSGASQTISNLASMSKMQETIHSSVKLPETFALGPNYPNPFNLETRIEYALPEQSNVRLAIYNVRGQQVRILVNESQSAGFKNVLWNGRNDFGREVSSGIYFIQLVVKQQSFVRRVTLQK